MSEKPTLKDLLERDKGKLDEIARLKETTTVDTEWAILSEIGLYYGWEAVRDIRADKITGGEMNQLLLGARMVNSLNRYNNSIDTYLAFVAAQSKKGVSEFKKHLSDLRKTWQ